MDSSRSDSEDDLLEAALSNNRDPFTTSELDLVSDESGKHDVMAMIRKICWSRELDLDKNAESSDTVGLVTYLKGCRAAKIRPCITAAQQISSKYLLLQHHGLKDIDVAPISAAIAVNRSITHLDLSDNSVCDEGAEALAKAFQHNVTTTTVNLRDAHIGW